MSQTKDYDETDNEQTDDEQQNMERKRISINRLALDPMQSRKHGGISVPRDELVQSIEDMGIMSDLLVRPVKSDNVDVDYQIIAGSRRFDAAINAGKREVPCKVIRVGDYEAAKRSLQENEERKDLSYTERAESLLMQYELIKPDEPPEGDPWVCPNCDREYDTSRGLHQHYSKADDHDSDPSSSMKKAVTRQQAYQKVADDHFDMQHDNNRVRKVKRLIAYAELPGSIRGVFKPAGERTPRQKKALKDRVSHDCVIPRKHTTTIRDLYAEFARVDGVDPGDGILKLLRQFDTEPEEELGNIIEDFTDHLSEQISETETESETETDTDTPDDQQSIEEAGGVETETPQDEQSADETPPDTSHDQQSTSSLSVDETVIEYQEQREAESEPESESDNETDNSYEVTIQLDSDELRRLHEKAKVHFRSENHDSEMFKVGYQSFLKRIGAEQGWLDNNDSE